MAQDSAEAVPSDTLAYVHLLHKQYYSSQEGQSSPPVPLVLVHQLYSVLEDRTAVDTEVEEAREQGRIRLLKLTSSKDVVVALEKDYRDFVRRFHSQEAGISQENLEAFHDKILLKRNAVSLGRTEIRKLLELDQTKGDAVIQALARVGFLVRSVHNYDEAVYYFALPSIGQFVTNVLEGRKRIVALIKRNKYKEILESKLAEKGASSKRRKRRKLHHSSPSAEQDHSQADALLPYGAKFHVDDAIGCGLVRVIKTPMGRLLKLVDG